MRLINNIREATGGVLEFLKEGREPPACPGTRPPAYVEFPSDLPCLVVLAHSAGMPLSQVSAVRAGVRPLEGRLKAGNAGRRTSRR
jgi:hypothetical protein